ncbi:hypothetical protein [Paenibacillus sp. YYML68]|uniref:hypothetical protein n=1 Tax=Paenibacillus sp. YYML68 TaxID=2909250 RepID=UPI0024923A01|nr:hypothetical protein [Paenibacillus sp. YYML68]
MGNEVENKNTSKFIKMINSYNNQKFDEYILLEYDKAITDKNISKLYELIKERPVADTLTFEKMFDLAFEKISYCYEEEIWRFIHSIINTQASEYVRNFIETKLEARPEKSVQLKYRKLLNELDEINDYQYLNFDSEYE